MEEKEKKAVGVEDLSPEVPEVDYVGKLEVFGERKKEAKKGSRKFDVMVEPDVFGDEKKKEATA